MNKHDRQNLWLLLMDIGKREKKTMMLIGAVSLVCSARPFISIMGMGALVDAVYAGVETGVLFQYAIMIVVSLGICSIAEGRANESLEQKQDYTKDLEAILMNRKAVSMDYEYLEEAHVRNLRSRAFAKSYYGIRGWYLIVLRNILTQGLSVVLTFVILAPTIIDAAKESGAIDFVLGMLVLFLLLGIINWIVIKLKLYYTEKVNDGYNTIDYLVTKKRYYMDMLAGVEKQKDLRIFNQREEINKDIWRVCKKLQEEERKRSIYYNKRNISTIISSTVSGLLIYLFVARNAHAGVISIGNVVVLSSSIVNMSVAVAKLAGWIGNLKNVAVYAQDYLEFMNLEKRKYPGTIPVEKRQDHRFHVSFENVSFRYPGTKEDVIKNLSLEFEIGGKMAIVGKNGSGKSTFIKLLCRLYDVTEGCIKVNGIDIRKYNYQEYCALLAVVFQDFSIFSFVLGENIAASVEMEEERVMEALQKVGLRERLEELKAGLDTYVGTDYAEEGISFSGGEQQKMAIARAIYKDAPFVVMDEPTAALDPLAECEVYAGFDKMVGKKTALYISHRLASCRFCEDILVFDKGQVVQRGGHEKLKEQEGIYKELWNAQAQYYA